MHDTEFQTSKSHDLIKIIEYIPNSITTKTLLRKTTGHIRVVAIDAGKTLNEKASPFDTFIQVIEGVAEVIIDKESNMLKTGQGIIIPPHTAINLKAKECLKMISTLIKSGYD